MQGVRQFAMDYLLIIILGGGALLVTALWRRRGQVARWRRHQLRGGRTLREDALKVILHESLQGPGPTVQAVAGALEISLDRATSLLDDLERRELVTGEAGRLQLTSAGRQAALQIVRAHRLWESHLAEETSVDESRWHEEAERREHLLTRNEADALATRLGHPARDPHGDPIPTRDGELTAPPGITLTSAVPGRIYRITHVEDEPRAVYAEITRRRLRVGMEIQVTQRTPRIIRFIADGEARELTRIVAQNLNVEELPSAQAGTAPSRFLADLPMGQRAVVVGLSQACRGIERRRLLDLGFVAGTTVEAVLASPTGRTIAYRVRETLIALRDEQARRVKVDPAGPRTP